MDWTMLRKPGRNGFLLIMLSLTWWGKLSEIDNEWVLAVADVTEALRCLCQSSLESASSPGPWKWKLAVLGSSGHNINVTPNKQPKQAKANALPPAKGSSRTLRQRHH
jgi:hypothetical protein